VRRIVIILVLAAAVVLGAFLLIRKPKKVSSPRARRQTIQRDSLASIGRERSATRGRTTGSIRVVSKGERIAERKRLREAERKRRQELRRQEREKRRMLRYAHSRRGSRRRRGQKGTYYVVKAVVSLGKESYALIDNRRVRVGDVVMGRKILAIQTDQIEVDAFGRRNIVRVGESLLPPTYSTRERRRI